MAYDYENPKIGDVVYDGYNPKSPGVITYIELGKRTSAKGYTPEELETNNRIWSDVTVKTVKGEFVQKAIHLKCFKTLIDETQKKLDNHKARLKTLKTLGETK